MICSKCGKEIPDQSVFCLFCGFQIPAPAEDSPAQEKNFSFSIFTNSSQNIYEVNQWLETQKMIIDSVSCSVTINSKMQAALSKMKIIWHADPVNGFFHRLETIEVGYFAGDGYSKLNKNVQSWIDANPDQVIVWKKQSNTQHLVANTPIKKAIQYFICHEKA